MIVPTRPTRVAHVRAALLGAAAFVAGCAPPTREERAAELFQYCTQCHGDRGEGRIEYGAPAIAGLDAWYVEAQLVKFRTGTRGDHPEDVEGLRMRPMSRALASDDEVRLVASYVASLPPVPSTPTLEGDPERGRTLYASCVQCHGADARGNRAVGAPPLVGASDWYLLRQLRKFRDGVRGTDPMDPTGAQMRPQAVALGDEQSMRDVLAYVSTLAREVSP
ncbi:MAG: c-type cytochrome [Myxococcales bacterium]|nr:c-type cytochrome [Myxococcales bacterium]